MTNAWLNAQANLEVVLSDVAVTNGLGRRPRWWEVNTPDNSAVLQYQYRDMKTLLGSWLWITIFQGKICCLFYSRLYFHKKYVWIFFYTNWKLILNDDLTKTNQQTKNNIEWIGTKVITTITLTQLTLENFKVDANIEKMTWLDICSLVFIQTLYYYWCIWTATSSFLHAFSMIKLNDITSKNGDNAGT